MPTETTTDAVLNGIVTCDQCNAGMALKQDETTGRLYFTCSQMAGQGFDWCLTPDLDANQLDKLVVETVMKTIMTRKHLNRLIAKIDQLLASKLEGFQDCQTAQEAQLYSRSDLRAMTTSHSSLGPGGRCQWRRHVGPLGRSKTVPPSVLGQRKSPS